MDTKDASQAQLTGILMAVRLVVAALVKTHPAPEQLLQEIRTQLDRRSELDHRLAEPMESAFDGQLHEFTSLIYARISR
jgi:hypothetical protein